MPRFEATVEKITYRNEGNGFTVAQVRLAGSERMAAVGADNMPFEKILRALCAGGGVKYALVEQDDCYGQSPFDCLKASYDYLRGLGLK